MIRRALAGLLLLALVSGAASSALGAPAPARRPAATRTGAATVVSAAIEWREWSREAFDEARDKKKLVLLDITATWCHWCRVMAEDSYADSSVVAEVRANFVPIRVDYDLRPDIGDRYLTNGWPTTGVLSSNGHLLLSKTYLPPSELRRFLAEATKFYRLNRVQVERKVAEAEKAVERTWAPDSLLPPSLSEKEYIDQNIEALIAAEDKEHGGFGSAPKTARWDAISFLLRAADARRDDRLRALAVRATVAALALQDSVDGGFFRFALEPDWTKIRYERLLDEQASALSILSRVYRATGEERFKVAAARVAEFAELELLKRQRAPKGSLAENVWRHSVGPDLRRHDGTWMDGEVYFRLSRSARPKQGSLPVSPVVVTDASARMISAVHSAQGGALGRQLLAIFRKMGRGDGSLFHGERGRDRAGEGLLADQVAAGNAALDVYVGTGDRSWLDRADTLANWMRAELWDSAGGGFRYARQDRGAIGRLKAGDKPERANVEAATFFLRKHWLQGRPEDKDVAAKISYYLRSGDKVVLDPARAELVLRLEEDPVRLLVIDAALSQPGGHATSRLYRAASAWGPDVLVRSLRGVAGAGQGSWPDGVPAKATSPAIYRWTSTGWRGPVTDPQKIDELFDEPAARP